MQGKRPLKTSQGPSKKRKITHSKSSQSEGKTKAKAKVAKKERASEQTTIPIPDQGDDFELSDQDLELVNEYGTAASFLGSLDEKGIARSKKEQDRLHRLTKPAPKSRVDDDLPSINSHSDDDEAWSSGIDDDALSKMTSDSELSEDESSPKPVPSNLRAQRYESGSDIEASYEAVPRKRRSSWNESDDNQFIDRLPIKLADGRIQKSGEKVVILTNEDHEDAESDEDSSEDENTEPPQRVETVATGARFGRPAVLDVIGNKSRHLRIQGAKEQIAGICQEIVGDPENSLGLLRRLHTFSLTEISTPAHPEPVPNDPIIRKLAILSQLAVFKDILPGYRIRALTDTEKAEKVGQMVARTREWEQGLVGVYQSYLQTLEAEIKAKTDLADSALRCICTLLVDVTHFNFRTNLMSVVVARLSRKSWDEASDLCLNSIISVFRADETGLASLEIVRLLNRMIKERRFNVHPDVLACLLHLRLKTELGVRASEARVEREDRSNGQSSQKGKGKGKAKLHLSKKGKKALKERKEIEKELKEAEAEVDKEERSSHQTEALKLLFVLYFRILKNPDPTPLLPAALRGISKFAHLVSIDFFKDLMKVLKELIARESHDAVGDLTSPHAHKGAGDIRHKLQCIVTAFELLSGQGEALNIDLSDFIAHLYTIVLASSLAPDMDSAPAPAFKSDAPSPSASYQSQSTADLLFRALRLAFHPHPSAGAAPPWRAAAFAKRLLTAALHWPAPRVRAALAFVAELLARDALLEALLSTEDRAVDGVYRAELEDPQLCNPFATSLYELRVLEARHPDARVRADAAKLARFKAS